MIKLSMLVLKSIGISMLAANLALLIVLVIVAFWPKKRTWLVGIFKK